MCAALILLPFVLEACCSARLVVARWRHPEPEGYLVLGGHRERILWASKMPEIQESSAPVFYSSGTQAHLPVLTQAGIRVDRVVVDLRAYDTLSNFTTLVDDFKERNIRHVRVITSEGHVRRASGIARVVLGSNGIAYTFEPVSPSYMVQESRWLAVRDYARAWIWRCTGWTVHDLSKERGAPDR